jgi:hypothetical protein
MADPTNTNVGPVTTLFTPPASCYSVTTTGADSNIFPDGLSVFIGNFNGNVKGNNYIKAAKSCYPSGKQEVNFFQNYYWSPAYCPVGHTPACSMTVMGFESPTTASLCCPKYVGDF